MLLDNPFELPGNWYKGNLHAHTTNSDGDLPPDKLCEFYREQGYDILAITDHNRVTPIDGLGSDDFLVLPGAELDAAGPENGTTYHLASYGLRDLDGISREMDGQDVIDAVNAKGGAVHIAHPYWSDLTLHDVLRLSGMIGLEVYNTSCEFSIGKGYAEPYWDAFLARAQVVRGIAADDVHWHHSDHRPVDAAGGWVMVKATELTETAILDALRAGHFYASNGPTIEGVRAVDGKVVAKCADCRSINVIANRQNGERFEPVDGSLISEIEWTPRGRETYARLECHTPDGQVAWSQPLWVGGA